MLLQQYGRIAHGIQLKAIRFSSPEIDKFQLAKSYHMKQKIPAIKWTIQLFTNSTWVIVCCLQWGQIMHTGFSPSWICWLIMTTAKINISSQSFYLSRPTKKKNSLSTLNWRRSSHLMMNCLILHRWLCRMRWVLTLLMWNLIPSWSITGRMMWWRIPLHHRRWRILWSKNIVIWRRKWSFL